MAPPLKEKQSVCVFSRLPLSGQNKSLPPISIDLSRVAQNVPMVPFPKFENASAPISPKLEISVKFPPPPPQKGGSSAVVSRPRPTTEQPTRKRPREEEEEEKEEQVAALQMENSQLLNKVRILEKKLSGFYQIMRSRENYDAVLQRLQKMDYVPRPLAAEAGN